MMEKSTNLVYIYSIPRETATNVSNLTNPNSGKKLNKTKIGNCTDRVSALFSASKGGLANGLSYKPWIEEGAVKKAEDGTELTLQHKMERKWNLAAGFLNNFPWRQDSGYKNMSYYQVKYWVMNDGATVLDLNTMDHELAYYMFLDSKYVANSEKEWKEHKWPEAKWYIALHNEADELKASKKRIKAKAIAALVDPDLPYDTQLKFVHILGLAPTSAKLSPDGVYNLLDAYIDTQNSLNVSKFMELYNDTKTAPGQIEIEAKHLLKRALDSKIMYEKQGTYNWPRPDGVIRIGETHTEAIDYLTDPKKSTLVQELQDELKLKGY